MIERILLLLVGFIQVANAQKINLVEVLETTPYIDGKLDSNLSRLKEHHFNYFFNFGNTDFLKKDITYRMGYTPTHFYLYIELKADSITIRDRGFINGDGFKLLFAKPQTDSSTTEYYDIVFSPSKEEDYWARKRIWEYNRNQNSGKRLTNTQFKEAYENGICGFEVLLAWSDIEPYHPWFSDTIGYNLYFANAIADNNAQGYAVTQDEGIWDEEVPMRNYIPLKFEKQKLSNKDVIIAKSIKRNIKTTDPLSLKLVSCLEKKRTETVQLMIKNNAGSTIIKKKQSRFKAGFHTQTLTYDVAGLPQGIYELFLLSKRDTIARYDFTIFPQIDFDSIHSTILDNTNHLERGTVNTLVFKINEIRQKLTSLKEYEAGKKEYIEFEMFEKEYKQFLNGKDPYKGITKNYRRAFQSKYDNSYQTYSIKLPDHYDPKNQYPLLVFLHGSGQDEQSVLNQPRSGGNFIELAPYGRDMYQCYSSDSSQNDIVEAIEDVKLHFSVDTQKIVIGGFSMGGYGAMRTYYEYPDLYKGVAIFAGHPNLANEWLGDGHPNFLDEKYLQGYQKIPVFVYHGKKDGALPISKAEEFILALKENGFIVTNRLIEYKAHEYPDIETNSIYFEWLNNVIKE